MTTQAEFGERSEHGQSSPQEGDLAESKILRGLANPEGLQGDWTGLTADLSAEPKIILSDKV